MSFFFSTFLILSSTRSTRPNISQLQNIKKYNLVLFRKGNKLGLRGSKVAKRSVGYKRSQFI